MILPTQFLKQADIGGAGDYFQRREEQGALEDEHALRAGFYKMYPDAWSPDPVTGVPTIDLDKVPKEVRLGYTKQLHDINKKWNGNLFGQGQTTGVDRARLNSMGYKMLPKASPRSIQELYYNQMKGDWARERKRMSTVKPGESAESIDSAMTKRWGKNWMTRPQPQPVPPVQQPKTQPVQKPGTQIPVVQQPKTAAYNLPRGAEGLEQHIEGGDAALEGFKEGLVNGVVKGDSFKGLTRGALNELADTTDFAVDAPIRTLFINPLLAGKAVTKATGNDKLERIIRAMRDKTVSLSNVPAHLLSKGYRSVANSSALDPKYLPPEAYDLAVGSGKGGVILGSIAAEMGLPGAAVNALAATQIPDAVTRGAAAVDTVRQQAIDEAKHDASQAAAIDILAKRHIPAGPVVEATPDIKSFDGKPASIMDIAGQEAFKKSPEGKKIIRDQIIQDYKDVINYDRALAAMKQTAGAGIGGLVGLTAAHQITKRIPALKKKRILRYLINMVAATGLGYAGWKATRT